MRTTSPPAARLSDRSTVEVGLGSPRGTRTSGHLPADTGTGRSSRPGDPAGTPLALRRRSARGVHGLTGNLPRPAVAALVERRRPVLRPLRVLDWRHPSGPPRLSALFPGVLHPACVPYPATLRRLAAPVLLS